MAIQLNANIRIAAPAPIDDRYLSKRTVGGSPLPYSSTTEVFLTNGGIPYTGATRYTGLTVNINGEEWWFKNGVQNGDLEIKQSGGGTVTGATNGVYLDGKVVKLGGDLGGDVVFSGGTLRYLTHPTFTGDTQIIDKKYADMLAVGVHPKAAVKVATTGNISPFPPTGLTGTTIDGFSGFTSGDRILIKDQTNQIENGVYSASTGIWGRTADFDGSPSGETLQGSLIPVVTGATLANTLWVMVEPKDYTGNTQSVVFTLFSSPSLTAGLGINITGSTIFIDAPTYAVISAALTGATGGGIGISGRNVCLDATTQAILSATLTGATNGLHVGSQQVGLGGTLTGDTTIETSTAILTLGSAGRNIVVDPTGGANGSVLIGECTMSANYIYTDSTETVIDSGAGKMCLCSNDIAVTGTHFKYDTHPTVWTGATQIVDVAYVTGRTAGATTYQCASPSTTLVGGMQPGTALTGRGLDDILQEILVPYLAPLFSTFSINVSSPVEVGTTISGTKSFSWSFANGSNVSGGTMCIIDVTHAITLASNISTTSPQSVTITGTTFTSCGQAQQWHGVAKNTHSGTFTSSNATVSALYPYYWGIVNAPGPSGAGRPSAASIVTLINSGSGVGTCHKILANSDNLYDGSAINFNSTGSDYMWFAIPSTVTNKLKWCVTPSNCGSIGGAVNPGGNLFPSPDENCAISSLSPVWSTTYDIYISNKQSENTSPMGFKLS
jgi:hypothetical protein